jgi:hypothetical protein
MPILYSDEEPSLEPHRYVPQMTRLVMCVNTVRCRIGIGGALGTKFLDPEVSGGADVASKPVTLTPPPPFPKVTNIDSLHLRRRRTSQRFRGSYDRPWGIS